MMWDIKTAPKLQHRLLENFDLIEILCTCRIEKAKRSDTLVKREEM